MNRMVRNGMEWVDAKPGPIRVWRRSGTEGSCGGAAKVECNGMERNKWKAHMNESECINNEKHSLSAMSTQWTWRQWMYAHRISSQTTSTPSQLPRLLCASSYRICFFPQPPLTHLFKFLWTASSVHIFSLCATRHLAASRSNPALHRTHHFAPTNRPVLFFATLILQFIIGKQRFLCILVRMFWNIVVDICWHDCIWTRLVGGISIFA